MSNKIKKSKIEIERNPIENLFMVIKDFSRKNTRRILTAVISFVLLFVVSITAYALFTRSSEKELVHFESVIDSFRADPANPEVKSRTISELRKITSESKFGFVYEMSHYFLGNIYYTDRNFNEAYNMFKVFIKKTSDKEVFRPIAVNKAAISLEEMGKVDEALSLLLEYEEDGSVVQDQILYNIARLYSIKNNQIKAREYYNNLISNFPGSIYAERSRERLFLMPLTR